jgi:hypothetical protein
MSKRRPYIGPSEAQANAEALMRRSAPYTKAADASVRIAWDWRKRQPKDLREAVRMVQAAYASEVPTKLHEAAIGEGGTPKMTARAEGYIFGNPKSDNAARNPETGERDPIGEYHAPFRARLAELMGSHAQHPKGYDCQDRAHRQGVIVQHVAIGGQDPFDAAVAEGVPSWCAGIVAKDALFFFLHSMSDLRLHLSGNEPGEAVTAA